MKAFLFLFLFLVPASGAMAQAKPGEICADILDVKRERGLFRTTSEASFRLLDLWTTFEAEEPEPGATPQGAIAFTTSGGIFRTINCNGDDDVLELQEYFPVGTLVKPLMRLVLESPEDDVSYILVLTEHGHRKVVREDVIQYMIEGASYIFPTNVDPVAYCAGAGGPDLCPGNQRTITEEGSDVPRAVCAEDRCPPQYEIGVGERGYAVAALPSRRSGEWNAIGRVMAAHEAVGEAGYLGVAPQIRSDYCAPIPVRAYRYGRLHQPYIGPQRSGGVTSRQEGLFLTLCRDRTASTPSIAPLRIVTKASAQERFANLPDGAFYRRFAEENTTIATILRDLLLANSQSSLDARVTDIVSCVEERETVGQDTVSLGGGLSLDVGVLGIEATAKRMSTWKAISSLGKREHLRISAYIAPGFRETASSPWLLDMVFKADCQNSTVEKPASIVLQHPGFADNHLDIGYQEMLVNGYFEDWGPEGFDNQVPLSRMEAGQFFEIHGPQAYFYWRQSIPGILARTTMADYVSSLPRASDRDRVYEFYTHLLLAGAFFYTDRKCLEGPC